MVANSLADQSVIGQESEQNMSQKFQILDPQHTSPSFVKLRYLEQENKRLLSINEELSCQNSSLRELTKSLSYNNGTAEKLQIKELQEENNRIVHKYDEAIRSNQALQSELLLSHQINEENLIEFRYNLWQLQEKVTAMRRLICQKQDIIAKMEKHGQQGVNCYQVEPGKTALLFLAQLEDLQNIIRQLTRYNDDLKKENEKHAETIKTLQTKLNMLQIYCKSNFTYSDLKQYYLNKQKRFQSTPKYLKNQTPPKQLLSDTKTSIFQSCKLSSAKSTQKPSYLETTNNQATSNFFKRTLSPTPRIPPTNTNNGREIIKTLLTKEHFSNKILRHRLRQKGKAFVLAQMSKLAMAASKSDIQKEKHDLMAEIKHYQKMCKDLQGYFTCKTGFRRWKSTSRTIQQDLKEFVVPDQTYWLNQQKAFWRKSVKEMKLSLKNVGRIIKKQNRLRSLSCLVDYRSSNIYLSAGQSEAVPVNDSLCDFSVILNQPVFQEQLFKINTHLQKRSTQTDLKKNQPSLQIKSSRKAFLSISTIEDSLNEL